MAGHPAKNTFTQGPQYLPPGAPPEYARNDPTTPARVLASPGRRLGARLIDVVILWALITVTVVLIAAVDSLINSGGSSGGPLFIIPIALIGVGWLLYEPLFVCLKGGTPGKLWLGIRVVRKADSSRPGFGTALGRFLFSIAMALVPLGSLLNVLWLLWDRPLYQCLHDKVASTVVVHHKGEQA
jgi:uncharacterized RDD family membrane protein YckC